MNEHLIITELPDGLLRIKAESGYRLWNELSQRFFSEAVAKSTDGWKAILNGVPPEPHVRTLAEAKLERVAALKAYDSSPAVNTFYLNENAMWIDYNLRNDYTLKVQSAKRQGIQAVPFLGQEIPVDTAMDMLDAVNIYAMQCTGVTDAHEAAINALTTIDAVDNYDYTVGYPEKLNF